MLIKLEQIKDKITEKTGMTEEEFYQQVDVKVNDLKNMISKEGAGLLIAKEQGIDLYSGEGNVKIKDLIPGMKLSDLAVKILKVYEIKSFDSSRGPGKVGKALVGDETGKTLMVFWNDKTDLLAEFKEEDTVVLSNLVVKTDNKERAELAFGKDGSLEVNPEGLKIDVPDQFTKPVKKKLNELEKDEENVEVDAVIVQILDPVFFDLDKEGKKINEEDQKEPAEKGAVVNLFVDDGSGKQVRLVLWKKQIMHLLNIDEDKLLSYKDNIDGFEEQKHELLGKTIKVIGRTSHNKMFDDVDLIARMVYDEQEEKPGKKEGADEEIEDEVVDIDEL